MSMLLVSVKSLISEALLLLVVVETELFLSSDISTSRLYLSHDLSTIAER